MKRRSTTVAALLAAGLAGTLAFGGAAFAAWSGSGNSGAVAAVGRGPARRRDPRGEQRLHVDRHRLLAREHAEQRRRGRRLRGEVLRRLDERAASVGVGCAGTLATLTCTETGVPDGHWYYTVTPTIGTKWVGAAGPAGPTVTVDTTAPATATLTALPATIRNGQGLTGSGTDAGSGVASIVYRYVRGARRALRRRSSEPEPWRRASRSPGRTNPPTAPTASSPG